MFALLLLREASLQQSSVKKQIKQIKCCILKVNMYLFGSVQIVDLDKGLLMNENGRVLQDSQGKPRRVILGEDGRTIFGLFIFYSR